jgi:[ribosomal protein S5]-alanine N-acetyltransferase
MIETIAQLKSAPPFLISDRLSLQILNQSDISSPYIDWMNDRDVVRYTEQRFNLTTWDNTTFYINQMAESSVDLFYGIYQDGMHVGTIKLGAINALHKTADLSYIIGAKEYWGLGIASSSIEAMIEIGFSKLDLVKISAGVYANNIGSSRVLEKNGFVLEGVRKVQFLYEDQRVDGLLYGKVQETGS